MSRYQPRRSAARYNRDALGRKVKWSDLPADVQKAVIQDGVAS